MPVNPYEPPKGVNESSPRPPLQQPSVVVSAIAHCLAIILCMAAGAFMSDWLFAETVGYRAEAERIEQPILGAVVAGLAYVLAMAARRWRSRT